MSFPYERWAECYINLAKDGISDGISLLSCVSRAADKRRIAGLAAAQAVCAIIKDAVREEKPEEKSGVEVARALIFLLIKRGHFKEIDGIIEHIKCLAEKKADILAVRVEAADEAALDFLPRLKAKLLQESGAKDVRFDVVINPALISGYKLSTGSFMQDFSILGKLDLLKNELSK